MALIVCMSSVFSVPVFATADIHGAPRLINLFLNWQLREEDLPQLARWDVVVLDADQQTRYPDRMRRLRQLNPAIKLLAYLPSEEIADARFSEPSDYPMAKLAAQIKDEWYVRDASGEFVAFWPGTRMLDVTDRAPVSLNRERWQEFLPRFIQTEIMSSGLWDGVFLDNTFDGITHFVKTSVDLNRDGLADTPAEADRAWRAGMFKLLRRIHELSPHAILIGNGGAVYAEILNGALFEHFPSWSWAPNWKEFRASIARNRRPAYGALNVNTDNLERPTDYRLMRFGLASALVGGGHYSFDKGDQNHEVLWWYDEYEIPLGKSIAQPVQHTSSLMQAGSGGGQVWSREFQHGLVLVNSSDLVQRVRLPGVFEQLKGKQDPNFNTGSIVTTLELGARDGALLLRRAEPSQIHGTAFINGAFVRVYDFQGRQTRHGFFTQRLDAPSGATMVTLETGDGVEDLVSAYRGAMTVRFGRGGARTWYPFGRDFTGAMSLAIGKTKREPDLGVIVARAGSTPEVKIFSLAGKLLSRFEAYRSDFRGGVQVAIGDLEGVGLRQIVTGAGPGGGPHIRIWKTDGQVWGGGFFAFDASERGGVSVAVGDVDGDGKDEIVVASGQGAIPRVRIFDARGTLKGEIRLSDQPLSAGLQVFVADINGDGKAEIFVSGLAL